MIKRIMGIIIIIGAIWLIISLGLQCISTDTGEPPDAGKAPYVITTFSRIYYAQDCIQEEGAVILRNYWGYHDNEWRYTEGSLILDKKGFGKISIVKRK